jgi:hypothetical protein
MTASYTSQPARTARHSRRIDEHHHFNPVRRVLGEVRRCCIHEVKESCVRHAQATTLLLLARSSRQERATDRGPRGRSRRKGVTNHE